MGAFEARHRERSNLAGVVCIAIADGCAKGSDNMLRTAEQAESGKAVGVDPSLITARKSYLLQYNLRSRLI